ncbi:MAG TPA: universal stress protein [bacterium]|nr:universal stress protein [bacterium]
MFERILVPLDGSAASEMALPRAQAIAQACGSTLILAHIIESDPPKTVHGQPHLSEAGPAALYLQHIADRLRAMGLSVETHVHTSDSHDGTPQKDLAETLAAHTVELGFDLAVMAAHGSRGALDFLTASMPLKAAAAGCSAVYLVRGRHAPSGAKAPRAIIVPLDGEPAHEAALPQALALAAALRLPVELLAVIPRTGFDAGGKASAAARLSPALSGASYAYAAETAGTYLAALGRRLSDQCASDGAAWPIPVSWRLERGRPSGGIVRRARATEALVVLSTHRRLGFDAALEGCVAFTVSTAYDGDSLIVPVASCV